MGISNFTWDKKCRLNINSFLSARFCWDSGFSLHVKDQNFKFSRTIGYGDWTTLLPVRKALSTFRLVVF